MYLLRGHGPIGARSALDRFRAQSRRPLQARPQKLVRDACHQPSGNGSVHESRQGYEKCLESRYLKKVIMSSGVLLDLLAQL